MSTAVWDNLGSTASLSGGNLVATAPGSGADAIVRSTGVIAGKVYIELTLTTMGGTQRPTPGLANTTETSVTGVTPNSVGWNPAFGIFLNSVDQAPGFGTGTTGDILGIAINASISRAWWRKNGGSWFPSGGDPATDSGGSDLSSLGRVYAYAFLANLADVLTANFGGSAYAASAPTGYGPLGGDNVLGQVAC
jgi:hypothetical protein